MGVLADDIDTAVCAGPVDNDMLEIAPGLASNAVEGLFQSLSIV